MDFVIDRAEHLGVSDNEISTLLHQVYVDGGYTSSEVAQRVFEPSLVRKRGQMFTARNTSNNQFAGMVIIVPPTSSAISLAKENECEMHLLGVKPEFRGSGLGRKLVAKAIQHSEINKYSKIILWTQKSMLQAQQLYESFGFRQTKEMTKNGIEFLVYERNNITNA
ncbi:MAG: GNAT family N-acetyltransferase [Gammaproteobacteria bacterium]|nr:GNAT family N-acetyltransferase [Gammaproteobacteria bacterium]